MDLSFRGETMELALCALCSFPWSVPPMYLQREFAVLSSSCFCSLEDAYNENDLMLYWKNGNDSLRTDEIALSQFFIEEFHPSYGLAFYSSTGMCASLPSACSVLHVLIIRAGEKKSQHTSDSVGLFSGNGAICLKKKRLIWIMRSKYYGVTFLNTRH